jgi:hypothetical protein
MEHASLFMNWATSTLQHAHPGPGAADDHDFSEATFPSLQALREASHAAEMIQELVADVHAPNTWSSGDGGGTAAKHHLSASWSFGATPGSGSNCGMMEAPATRGRDQLDLVHGPPATRRAGLRGLGSMSASYAQDHIIAERKRREKINQRFIELSTVIPGLKKVIQLIRSRSNS